MHSGFGGNLVGQRRENDYRMWYGVSFEKWCGKDLGIGPQINPRIGLKAVQPGARAALSL